MLDKIKIGIKIPFLALFSKNFYLQVLAMRGVGMRYLLLLCLALAVPATYQLNGLVQLFKSYEVSKLVAQIPPSYISADGVLSPKNSADNFAVINNSSDQTVMVYNPGGQALPPELSAVPFELGARNLIVSTQNGRNAIPWSAIFNTNADFEPYQSAMMLDEILNSSPVAFWLAAAVYLFSMLAFNTLLTGLLCKLLFVLLFRLLLSYGQCLRLMAYANTICAVVLTLQFFIYLPLSFGLMLVLPIIYGIFFGRDLRNLAMQQAAQMQRKSQCDQFTGNGTPAAGSEAARNAEQESDGSGNASGSSETMVDNTTPLAPDEGGRKANPSDKGTDNSAGKGRGGTFIA